MELTIYFIKNCVSSSYSNLAFVYVYCILNFGSLLVLSVYLHVQQQCEAECPLKSEIANKIFDGTTKYCAGKIVCTMFVQS